MKKIKTTDFRGHKVCRHNINPSYCTTCKNEAAGIVDHPLLRGLVAQGRVSLHVQVYANWEKDGVGGMQYYREEMESLHLPAPTPYVDECPLVLDEHKRIKSPWFAWQAKVSINGKVDDETRNAILNVASKDDCNIRDTANGMYVHSNRLCRSVLAMQVAMQDEARVPSIAVQPPPGVPVASPIAVA